MTELSVTPAERRLTLAALAVVVLLSALDQTIVATAMPRIIEQLQGLSMYAWVTTAYMLTSTVSVPIYGKLSDQYGRKGILILGVLLFLVGSALCGRAAMSIYAGQLVERIQRGVKVAFATSIAHMLERSLWIVGLAVVIVLFVPEVPLRSRTTPTPEAAD